MATGNVINKIGSELETAWEFVKRNAAANIVLALIGLALWFISSKQETTQEKLSKVNIEMQKKQDAVTAAITAKYADQQIPEDLINLKVKESIEMLRLTPDYRSLESQAVKLESEAYSYSPYKYILLAVAGALLSAVTTGIILFIMTAIPFTRLFVTEAVLRPTLISMIKAIYCVNIAVYGLIVSLSFLAK